MGKRKCKCGRILSSPLDVIENVGLTVLTGTFGSPSYKQMKKKANANIDVFIDGDTEIEIASKKVDCLLYIKFPYCPLCGGRLNG